MNEIIRLLLCPISKTTSSLMEKSMNYIEDKTCSFSANSPKRKPRGVVLSEAKETIQKEEKLEISYEVNVISKLLPLGLT